MRHLALYDVHCPRNIPLDPVLKFAQMYKPDEVVIGGDFMNLEFASHWNEAIFKHIGIAKVRDSLEKEFEAGRVILDELRQACPKSRIRYIPGNHEDWLYWCAVRYGYPDPGVPIDPNINFKTDLADMRNRGLKTILERVLKTNKTRTEVLPYNKDLDIGKITYLHGHQITMSRSLLKYPSKNIVYGHWHTQNTITAHNSGEMAKTIQHCAVPCLTGLGPGYLKSPSTRWLNGFWVADILPNGLFDGRVVKVLSGKIIGPNL